MAFLGGAIVNFLDLVEVLIILNAVMSWFIRPRSNDISRIVGVIIDPIMKPCKKIQMSIVPNSPFDFSPAIAILLIEFVKRIIYIIF